MEGLTTQSLLKTSGYIFGQWIESKNTFAVINPANENLVVRVSNLGESEANFAINAALAAYDQWKFSDPSIRADYLKTIAKSILDCISDLSLIETIEQGKPLKQSVQEWQSCAQSLLLFSEQAMLIADEVLNQPTDAILHRVLKQPIGVTLAITPWNFPAASVVKKCGAAIAAGCTVILKPSELTPLSALAFAELSHQAGLPKGVLNVLPTDRPAEVVQTLLKVPEVKLVTFTGSTSVGKKISQQCAKTVKKVELELGGNGPFIVFSEAKQALEKKEYLTKVAKGLIGARFYNSGQICVAANRIFIQNECFSEFVEIFLPLVESLKLGPGIQSEVDCGPLISGEALKKMESLIEDSVLKGARILTGGKAKKQAGYFFEPTVLVNVSPEMLIVREEIFGPIAALQPFDHVDEVLQKANQTSAGLAGYVYSQDQSKIDYFIQHLNVGMLGCNTTNIFDERLAFGGLNQSGYGREGGQNALAPFLISRNVSIQRG